MNAKRDEFCRFLAEVKVAFLFPTVSLIEDPQRYYEMYSALLPYVAMAVKSDEQIMYQSFWIFKNYMSKFYFLYF
jgi:hypothetical protein